MTTLVTDSHKGFFPDTPFRAVDIVPEALIFQASSVAGSVEGDDPVVRVGFIKDGAAGVFAEGVAIDEDNPELDELEFSTHKVAQIARLSNEAYRSTDVSSLISTSLRRSVTVKADSRFLGNITPPVGIASVMGINDAGVLGDDFDAVVDAIAAIEDAGGTATRILASPLVWAEIAKRKAADDSNQTLLGAAGDATARRLQGLPVLVSKHMPAETLLIVDPSAIVSAVGPLRVATSPHAAFGSDSMLIRATWRIGWGVVHPDRLSKVDVFVEPPITSS